jgi:hypothetical protein
MRSLRELFVALEPGAGQPLGERGVSTTMRSPARGAFSRGGSMRAHWRRRRRNSGEDRNMKFSCRTPSELSILATESSSKFAD